LKKGEPIQTVGLIGHPEQVAKTGIVRRIAKLIVNSGRKVFFDQAIADESSHDGIIFPDAAELARVSDLLVVIGGDGTVLRAARETAGSNTPLLGINAGRLGFLTSASVDDIEQAFDKLWSNKYVIDPLPLIQATGNSSGKKLKVLALNDILISRGANPRLIEMEVKVDGELLTDYRCDGLIIATPAGSTAYSLAAGGAVVIPRAEVLTLNPICPQALSNRPLIVSFASTIEVTILKHRAQTYLSADGQMQAELKTNDTIRIRRSRTKARLIRLEGNSFFETLRHKLNWTGSHA
jgi:NAD+ kinase